jgi:hypothetical protein
LLQRNLLYQKRLMMPEGFCGHANICLIYRDSLQNGLVPG